MKEFDEYVPQQTSRRPDGVRVLRDVFDLLRQCMLKQVEYIHIDETDLEAVKHTIPAPSFHQFRFSAHRLRGTSTGAQF